MTVLDMTLVGALGTLDIITAPYSPFGFGYMVTDPEHLVQTGRAWNRNIVTGPFQHGGAQTNAVMALDKVTMSIQILQPDHASVESAKTTLINWLSQSSFTLNIYTDANLVYSWSCFEADFAMSMNRQDFHANAPILIATITRQPVPLVGAF